MKIKSFLHNGGVPSQFIMRKTLSGSRGIPLGIAANILKQMNAKLGLDLYRLKIPQLNNSMVVGIDHIVSGPMILIGFSATSN